MHAAAKRRLVEELAEGTRRAARTITCPKCGAPCIRGEEHDRVTLTVTVDAEALDPAGEMLAILDGLRTFDLNPARGKTAKRGSFHLFIREDEHVDSTKPIKGTVHAQHRCIPDRKDTLW